MRRLLITRSMKCFVFVFLAICAIFVSTEAFAPQPRVCSSVQTTTAAPFSNHKQPFLTTQAPSPSSLVQNWREAHIVAAAPVSAASAATINRAAIKAISKLISTCGIGVFAAKVGILDQTALGVLSKLIFNIFQPCLLFVNVATTVAELSSKAGGGEAIYILPLAAGFQIIVGYIVGKIVSLFMFRGKSEDEGAKQLLACTTFGNSGPLPLVFTDGLFRSHPNPALLSKSVAYISLYLLGWSPLFWIVGPAILKENNPNDSSRSAAEKRKELLSRIFSPPVVASIFGMIVGFLPFLRKLFVNSNSIFNPIFESMRTLGAAYLPAVLIVLAGSLSPSGSKPAQEPQVSTAETTAENKQFLSRALAIYLARFVLMPTVAFSLFSVLSKVFPAVKALFEKDKLLLMILLLESCMPSAQNTTVILQLQGNKAAATRLARTLMVIYLCGVPALSYWLVRILSLTGLAA